jgi:hypothetical protein
MGYRAGAIGKRAGGRRIGQPIQAAGEFLRFLVKALRSVRFGRKLGQMLNVSADPFQMWVL